MLDLLGLKKSVGALSSQLKAQRAKIEELKRQREDVANAPAALEDVRAVYVRAVAARRESFCAGLRRAVETFNTSPESLLRPNGVSNGSLLFLASENYSNPPPVVIVENGIAALFSEQVVKALSSELEALDWSGAGLPLAKRSKKVAELDAQIAQLEGEFAALLTEARNAGIAIDVVA